MIRRLQISRRELKSTSDHKFYYATDRGSPSGTRVHPLLCLGESRSTSTQVWTPVLMKRRLAAKIEGGVWHGATHPIAERCRSEPALRISCAPQNSPAFRNRWARRALENRSY